MNRRGFVGALAGAMGATAAWLAAFRGEEKPIPVTVTRSYGTASIEDGGYEAVPVTGIFLHGGPAHGTIVSEPVMFARNLLVPIARSDGWHEAHYTMRGPLDAYFVKEV